VNMIGHCWMIGTFQQAGIGPGIWDKGWVFGEICLFRIRNMIPKGSSTEVVLLQVGRLEKTCTMHAWNSAFCICSHV
jgi:hypothetical protein